MKPTLASAGKGPIAAIAVLAVIAALSACSSGPNPVKSSVPIKIGVITSVGSALTNYPDIPVGAQAALKAINDAGGVNGRQIEMTFCNTRGDTNQAELCGQQLVDQGVVASIGQGNTYAASTLPITTAAKIPEIGNIPFGDDSTWTSPYSNPFSAGHPGNWAADAFGAKQLGAKSVVVLAVDSPGGQNGATIAETAVTGLGLELKTRITIPTTGIVDYAPYAQQAQDSGADAAIIIHGPVVLNAVLKAADSIGSTVKFLASAFTLGQSEAAAIPTLASNVTLASPLPSVNDTANPGVAQYLKELDANGVPEALELRRLAGFNAWLAMHAAAEVMKTITGEITKKSVVEALKTTAPIPLYGLLTFDPASFTTDTTTDKFPRVPKVPVYFLTYRDGKMVDAGLTPVVDAIQYSR